MRIANLICWLVVGAVVNVAPGAVPNAAWFPQAPPPTKPSGEIIRVSNETELFQAVKDVKAGGSILLADGFYRMPRYLEISTDNVTLRGASGDRNEVILDGSASRHGELVGITGCEGVTIADLTLQNVKWNGVKINSDRGAQRVTIHNCVIHNVWQRGVKAPAVPEKDQKRLGPRDCRVQYCLFYNDRLKQFSDDHTDTSETFNGNYIGGIDAKNTVDWNSAVVAAVQFPTHQATRAKAAAQSQKVGTQPKEVLDAMRKVHAGFQGQQGYVAQFGDSITYSMAFWSPIGWDEPQRYLTEDDGLPKQPLKVRWRDYVKGTRDKGPKFANYSGWRVGQLLQAMDAVLQREKPEVAIVMIGTNDISGGRVPGAYREELEKVIRKCLGAHCVPILNTIPPRRGHDKAVDEANKVIRDLATKLHVPLADFHAQCLRLRPGNSWDGTIISKDGVHPSGGKSNVYTEANMQDCGYALRNWVNFLVLRQLYFQVLNEQERGTAPPSNSGKSE